MEAQPCRTDGSISPRLFNEIKKIENQVYDLAFDIEMDTGVDISPIIKNEEQYEYWLDTLPFYKNIHEEGVIVNG